MYKHFNEFQIEQVFYSENPVNIDGLKINCLEIFVNNSQIKYRMFQSCVLI